MLRWGPWNDYLKCHAYGLAWMDGRLCRYAQGGWVRWDKVYLGGGGGVPEEWAAFWSWRCWLARQIRASVAREYAARHTVTINGRRMLKVPR